MVEVNNTNSEITVYTESNLDVGFYEFVIDYYINTNNIDVSSENVARFDLTVLERDRFSPYFRTDE